MLEREIMHQRIWPAKLMHKSKGYQTISAYLQPLTIAKTSIEINNGVLAYCARVVVLA